MEEALLGQLARRLIKCPFGDGVLFGTPDDLAEHLAEFHEALICQSQRVSRHASESEFERPSRLTFCGHCQEFDFVVPNVSGRDPIGEIASHIGQVHRTADGRAMPVSLYTSTAPSKIERFMAEQGFRQEFVCAAENCEAKFNAVGQVSEHWGHSHLSRPETGDIRRAIDDDSTLFWSRFGYVLGEILSETEMKQAVVDDGYRIRHVPQSPRVRSSPTESIIFVERELARLPENELIELDESEGIISMAEEFSGGNWVETRPQVAVIELRLCNIIDGFVPLVKAIRHILPPLPDNSMIQFSWMENPEFWFTCKVSKSKRAIYNLEGRLKTVFAALPSGVRLYVTRVGYYRYELSLKRHLHIVPDCKIFAPDGARGWSVDFRPEQIEWETGDDVFRHQITFEQMEALHAEARRTNLSVRDLVHRVMTRHAQNTALHVREVWDIVFPSRTCSLAAVWAQFRPEHECYERISPGRYRFNTNGAFPAVRYVNPAGRRVMNPRVPDEPHFPLRTTVEEPLLRAIADMGGAINFSEQGRTLEIVIAKELSIPDEDRDFHHPRYNSKGHRKWRNELQFVRARLTAIGQMEGNADGTWVLTKSGYRRIGRSDI